MKTKTRLKVGAISKLILKLAAAGALTGLAGYGSPTKANKALGALTDYSEQQIKRCIIYLRLQGYVRYTAIDDSSPLIITEKGMARLEARTVKERIVGSVKRRWDRLWRLVAFDVPERKKAGRDQFRRRLRDLGFFPFQKSIYATPFPCEDEIMKLARRYGISKYVWISVTPSLGRRESYAISWFGDEAKM